MGYCILKFTQPQPDWCRGPVTKGDRLRLRLTPDEIQFRLNQLPPTEKYPLEIKQRDRQYYLIIRVPNRFCIRVYTEMQLIIARYYPDAPSSITTNVINEEAPSAVVRTHSHPREHMCEFCYENRVQFINVPCGHAYVCESCKHRWSEETAGRDQRRYAPGGGGRNVGSDCAICHQAV